MTVSPPVRAWLPWLVLLSGLFVTAAGSVFVAESGHARDEIRFSSAGQEIISRLRGRVETAVALLRAGSAVMAAKDWGHARPVHPLRSASRIEAPVRGRRWHRVRWPLRCRGISGLEARMCAEGVRDFRVWSAGAGTGERSVVLYFEPRGENSARILGFDMASEPVRRAAMEAAAIQARPVASGKATFVLDPKSPPPEAAFIIFVPVYKGGFPPDVAEDRAAALRGFIYSPFRAKDLLGTLLEGEERSQFVVQVYNGDKVTPSALLFDSAHGEPWSFSELHRAFSRDDPGRQWIVVLAARPDFVSTSTALVPALFGIGLGLSVLLFLLTRAEARARDLAERAAGDLRESEETVQSASRAKDEFLATLSHELRTPLNAILGWARMLRDRQRRSGDVRTRASTPSSATRGAGAAHRGPARRVAHHLGQAAPGRRSSSISPASCDARSTRSQPARRRQGRRASQTRRSRTAGAIVAAIAERLQQVVWNLLSNAVKFTPRGGRVELTHRAPRQLAGRDHGVATPATGISPEFLPHVFERFRQADSSSTRQHGGLGLGLAIVRHLVELHGGTDRAASEGLGKGATFTVRLPLRNPALADQLESSAGRYAAMAHGPCSRGCRACGSWSWMMKRGSRPCARRPRARTCGCSGSGSAADALDVGRNARDRCRDFGSRDAWRRRVRSGAPRFARESCRVPIAAHHRAHRLRARRRSRTRHGRRLSRLPPEASQSRPTHRARRAIDRRTL